MNCSSCHFATKIRVAFDDERLFCGQPDAKIDNLPIGFVHGEEATRCGCYQEGQPEVEDLLIFVEPLCRAGEAGVGTPPHW